MPTKARREAELSKIIQAQLLETIPKHIQNFIEMGLISIEKLGSQDRYSSGKIIKFDHNGAPYITRNWGQSGSKVAGEERTTLRRDQASDLKRKFPSLWGVRGKAGIIARLSGKNIRTIQKYFKDFCS